MKGSARPGMKSADPITADVCNFVKVTDMIQPGADAGPATLKADTHMCLQTARDKEIAKFRYRKNSKNQAAKCKEPGCRVKEPGCKRHRTRLQWSGVAISQRTKLQEP